MRTDNAFAIRLRQLRLGVAVIFAALLLSCGGSDSSKGWTVLVYMVADNNLEPFALPNLNQMAQVGSSGNLRIVVEVDRSLKYSTDPIGNIRASATTKRLLAQTGSFQEIQDLGKIDTGTAPALADFIQWGIKTYPAANYALVLWDHGGAWKGFGLAETSGHLISLAGLTQGIRDGLAAAKVPKLQILGFDACLMSTFEVMEALKPFASYLIASEEVEPGAGWDYRKLQPARDNAAVDAVALSKSIIDGYAALNAQDGRLTMALTSVDALQAVEGALTHLDQQITPRMNTLAVQIGRARAASLEFGKDPSGHSYNMIDLGDMLGRLAQADATDFAALRDELKTALDRTIVYQIKSPAMSVATGMSVFFPPNGTLAQEYTSLQGVTSWRNFLSAYLAQGPSAVVPKFTTAALNVMSTPNELTVSGQLMPGAANSIATTTLTFGYSFPPNPPSSPEDEIDFYGDRPATFNQTTVTATWNRSLARFNQTSPSTQAFVYLSIEPRSSTVAAASIPLAYLPPGSANCSSTGVGFATRQILFDPNTGATSSDRYFLLVNGALSELRPQAGSKFVPVVYGYIGSMRFTRQPTRQGWLCTPTQFAADRTISLDFATPTLPAGVQRALILSIENVAGVGDAKAAVGTF